MPETRYSFTWSTPPISDLKLLITSSNWEWIRDSSWFLQSPPLGLKNLSGVETEETKASFLQQQETRETLYSIHTKFTSYKWKIVLSHAAYIYLKFPLWPIFDLHLNLDETVALIPMQINSIKILWLMYLFLLFEYPKKARTYKPSVCNLFTSKTKCKKRRFFYLDQ